MITVPAFVDFITAENAAAGMSRGLVERTDAWGRLVARAQRILAETQNALAAQQPKFLLEQLYDFEQSAPLIAAARILDAASQAENLDLAHRQRLALLSAAAFSMYGNFPAANAVIQNSGYLSEPPSGRMWLAIGCFSPRHLGNARLSAIEAADRLSSSAIEYLQSYLATGEHGLISRVDHLIVESFATCSDNLENLLLGYARISLRHVELLSTYRCLSSFRSIDPPVVKRLIDSGIATLLPSQFAVLCNSPLLSNNKNALLCLPTSTGKTLIGELAIANALAGKPGLAIYIAPYVAIGLQAARALQQHLPAPHRVHTLVGGLSGDMRIDSSRFSEVVVTTPERFDAILRRFNSIQDLRIVVVDEAHVVSDGVRGVRLEALLSRLRLQQQSGRSFRIVALSAVMAESEKFRQWLGVESDLFITCLWRPTARRVAIWRSNNKLTWLYAGDELRPQRATSTSIFGTRSLVWPERMYAAQDFAQTKSQSPALYANAAFLCRQMYEEYQEPVLCVCASRASSRGVAYRLAADLDEVEVLSSELAASITFIDDYAPHLAGLRTCLLRGVAFHNAALPLQLRQLIEKAVEKRVMKVVCATTTLAEGVDLPFRVTVLAEWLQWRMDTRDKQKPFDALKFRNIAGRSGRAGVFTEGDTIVFENVLGPSKFADQQNRTASILSMMERPNEVRSALEEDVVGPEMDARKQVLSSNFLAAIRENPDDQALEQSYADSLLVTKLFNGESIHQLTSKIREDVLGGGDLSFARAASPLRLTEIGEAANRSAFSPESCRLIIDACESIPESDDFEEIAAFLLTKLGGLSEQHNGDWSKMALKAGSKFVVKPRDLKYVLLAWRTGATLAQIFAGLPSVQNSKSRDNVSEWLAGARVSEDWSNRFDKFADFMDAVVETFLPWVLDACADLSAHMSRLTVRVPWDTYRSIVAEAIETRRTMFSRRGLSANPSS